MYKEEKEYREKYGALPTEREDLLKYFEEHKRIDWKRINQLEEEILSIPWKTLTLELPLVPKATPRPRYSSASGRFYVKGAKRNKKIISQYVHSEGIICTRTEFKIEIYLPTPSTMTVAEAYLAEKGVIRPISKPDWDNLGKTYCDAVKGTLLLDDNIINPGIVEKYYSIKPRVIIRIRYQTDFDCKFNMRRVIESKGYKELMESGN